jgi:hypothetical protein
MSESYRRRARRLHEARFPRTKRPGGLLAAPWRPAFPRPPSLRCRPARSVDAGHPEVLGGDHWHRQEPPADRAGRGSPGRAAAGSVTPPPPRWPASCPWPPANPSCHPPWPATAPCDLLCLDELGYLHLDSQGAELLLAGPDRTPTARLDRGCLQRAVPASGARGSPIPASRPRWSTG